MKSKFFFVAKFDVDTAGNALSEVFVDRMGSEVALHEPSPGVSLYSAEAPPEGSAVLSEVRAESPQTGGHGVGPYAWPFS